MKINKKYMKLLRTLHIFSASIWFGATVCIFGIMLKCFFAADEQEFLLLAPLTLTLYQTVVLPFALFTMLQGLIYSIFTNWGFLKHKWVTIKWLSVIVTGCLIGVGSISRMQSAIARAESGNFNGGFTDGYAPLIFTALQILVMIVMIILSVYKPFKSENKKR